MHDETFLALPTEGDRAMGGRGILLVGGERSSLGLDEPATATIRLSPPNLAAPLEGAVTALDKARPSWVVMIKRFFRTGMTL